MIDASNRISEARNPKPESIPSLADQISGPGGGFSFDSRKLRGRSSKLPPVAGLAVRPRAADWQPAVSPTGGWRGAAAGVRFGHLLRFSVLAWVALLHAGCAPEPSNRFQGYIEGEYVYVAAPLGGTLSQLAVARGDSVKAGQLLFSLERQSEADAVAQAEKNLAQSQAQLADLKKGERPTEIQSLQAQLERAQADLKLSAAELARREKLRGAAVISKEELDQARAQSEADQAQTNQLAADLATAKLGGREDAIRAAAAAVEAQRAALAKAQWSFDQKQQFAPTNGTVHDTLYRQGEFVDAANPVVVLLPPENIKVRFFVPQAELPRIHIGGTVVVRADGAGHPFQATVNYISTQAEYTPPVIFSRETRANLVFMIEARFSPAEAAELRPGQPVDVDLK